MKERDMRSQPTIRMVDPLSELSTDVNNSGCISRKRKVEETSQRSVRPKYCSSGSMPEDSLAFRNARKEAANAANTSPNRFVKKEIDDNGDLPEENRALDKKIKKKYIWVRFSAFCCAFWL
ncbi:unnamed protein product [Gongylonema pulchrum]|uniref:Uncharacterized protein n=1 Tax=Gongylonema pulchrum TaxID=637853 RepID=A0A183F0H8_9BILA|nr:unnamed protein product [Gongylonema pulchrum]